MSKLRLQPKKILSVDAARLLFNSKSDGLVKAVQEGLDQFCLGFGPELRQRARPRSLSGVLNDCICFAAADVFQEDADVKIQEEYEGKFFIFNSTAAVRFKKVDDDDRPRNYPTKRQLRAAYHQIELPGLDDSQLTIVNVGYQPDAAFAGIKSVSLICRNGPNLCWQIPLANELTAFLFDQDGNANRTAAPVVRPRLVPQHKANA